MIRLFSSPVWGSHEKYHRSVLSSGSLSMVSGGALMGTVRPDRVLVGLSLWRRLELPAGLVVPMRPNHELPETATYDYIEVSGTLRVSRIHDTRLAFTHFVVLPGGTLDAGTSSIRFRAVEPSSSSCAMCRSTSQRDPFRGQRLSLRQSRLCENGLCRSVGQSCRRGDNPDARGSALELGRGR